MMAFPAGPTVLPFKSEKLRLADLLLLSVCLTRQTHPTTSVSKYP